MRGIYFSDLSSKDKIASDVQSVIQIYDSGEIYFLGTDFTSDALYYYDGKNVERIDGGNADESIDVLQVAEGISEILYSIERYSNGGYQYEVTIAIFCLYGRSGFFESFI